MRFVGRLGRKSGRCECFGNSGSACRIEPTNKSNGGITVLAMNCEDAFCESQHCETRGFVEVRARDVQDVVSLRLDSFKEVERTLVAGNGFSELGCPWFDAAGMRLVDRIDTYRDAKEESWIDEMLITGDKIIVTGYSYETSTSNYSVFQVDREGRLSFLDRKSTRLNSSHQSVSRMPSSA